jgi:hypothetical protein
MSLSTGYCDFCLICKAALYTNTGEKRRACGIDIVIARATWIVGGLSPTRKLSSAPSAAPSVVRLDLASVIELLFRADPTRSAWQGKQKARDHLQKIGENMGESGALSYEKIAFSRAF